MSITFCPLFSGSSGNSVFLSTDSTKVLIDAGLSGKRIEDALDSIGESADELDALFITHEHSDHVSGAGVLSRRYGIPIYASMGTWDGIGCNRSFGRLEKKNMNIVYADEYLILNDIRIRPFAVPHDAAEPLGFSFFAEGYKITVATDIGHVTDGVRESVLESDVLLIESNHDIELLRNGSYPPHLKTRILGKRGHLSNVSAGQLISEIFSEKMKYIYLGHLSDENNRPDVAFETVLNILTVNNVPVNKPDKPDTARLLVAERNFASKLLKLG